jgi:hypothetical protein
MVDPMRAAGFGIPVRPQGAFYPETSSAPCLLRRTGHSHRDRPLFLL